MIIDFYRQIKPVDWQLSTNIEYYRLIDYVFDDRLWSTSLTSSINKRGWRPSTYEQREHTYETNNLQAAWDSSFFCKQAFEKYFYTKLFLCNLAKRYMNYVICLLGGPCDENLWPRSWKCCPRPHARRGQFRYVNNLIFFSLPLSNHVYSCWPFPPTHRSRNAIRTK